MTTRNLSRRELAIAGALAVAAALLTMAYVSRASGGTKVTGGPAIPVYVAAHDVKMGTAGATALSSHLLVLKSLPKADVAPNAITSPSQIQSLVALQPIYAGEQVTLRHFGAQTQVGVRASLSGDDRIVDVVGTSDQLLAGTVAAGDHVDVVASLKNQEGGARGRVVLRNVLVLKAPASAATSSGIGGGGTSSSAATIELTDAQAQRLFFVMKNGDWAFMLRPAVRATDSKTPVESFATVLKGTK